MKLSKRGLVRIVTYLCALTVTVSALIISGECKTAKINEEKINGVVRSVSDMRTYVDNIEATVTKGIYSSSGEMMSLVAENLARQTSAARYALSTIPESGELLSRTYMFLAQVSDFSTALSRKAGAGEEISDSDIETLYTLADYADSISEELGTLLGQVGSGEVSVDFANEMINTAISTIDQDFSEYPTLVYDGPFSDHIMNKTPALTQDAEEITPTAARSIAARSLGVPEENVSLKTETAGKIPAYDFASGENYASVSKNGGYLIYMMKNSYPGEITLTPGDALTAAGNYVKARTLVGMEKTYYEISDGVCYVNFAYTENEITFYPDLIKVGVDMSSGDILSYDARGYIVNHRERDLPDSRLDVKTAAEKLPRKVKYTGVRLALIPENSASERLCYEFSCKGAREEDLLIYLDAATGREVSVLILKISENGTVSR